MNSVAFVNIALEILAFVFLAIIMYGMLFDKNRMLPLNRSFIRILLCCLIVLSSDIVSWVLDGNPTPYVFFILTVSNFFVIAFSILAAAAYHDYSITFISTRTNISKKSVYVINRICWVHVLFLLVPQLNHMIYYIDETNRYCRGNLYFVPYIVPIVISMIQIAVILHHRKILGAGDTFALLSYNILLFTGVVLQSILNLIMLLYVCVSVGLFIVYIRIQVEQAKRLENELTQSRIAVMLSQIQPHFLYNSLAAISRLCDKDPAGAKKATIEFATYLRGNMDSLDKTEPILFEKELRHVEGFLNLQKAMYEEALNVVYNIKTKGFLLPVLTLQPIVENAVKHGIGKREGGGTVTISTDETETAYIIVVTDDGMGFDSDEACGDGAPHIGINNVRQRLHEQCGGTLEIESQRGAGTAVTMMIPKIHLRGGAVL